MKESVSCCLLIILLFSALPLALYAQNTQEDDDARFIHRFAWTRDYYALRYEVIIERMENRVFRTVLHEFTVEPYIITSLPPGSYRLRVIPYDFRDLPGEGTPWRNFIVHAVTDPLPKKHRDLYIGLFAEVIGYSRYGPGFGGGLTFGGSSNGKGIGFSFLYAQDLEGFTFIEALAHLRLYLSGARATNTGFFVQAEGGILFWFTYEISEITDNFAPVAGLRIGWRFPAGERWYIEPAIRGGYPYILGASITAGIRRTTLR